MSEEVKNNEFTFENPEYRQTYWHTCSHVMAQAVKRLWPEVKLAIGPSIDEGWYYDLDSPFPFTPEILEKLKNPEREMPAGHLGLRNVDRIVRLYYGREYGISARSEPGRGSRVELRLPMSGEEKKDA